MALTAEAFPTWMGVSGSYQHQSGGNPGTFTILMNQDYYGLSASVGIQVQGGSWKEYPMTYAGNVGGNSEWTFSPFAVFPNGASVAYYFHGYDSSGNIYDNNGGANYSLQSVAAPVNGIVADMRVAGDNFTLGSSASDLTQTGFAISYYDGLLNNSSSPSSVTFTSNPFASNFIWNHMGTAAASTKAPMMMLDSQNRLTLYSASASGTNNLPSIVLDPTAGQITIGGTSVGIGAPQASQTFANFTVGSNDTSSGANSFAAGDTNIASGLNSVALGNDTVARGFAQVVMGQWNAGGTETAGDRTRCETLS